jgi:hypothetical protein
MLSDRSNLENLYQNGYSPYKKFLSVALIVRIYDNAVVKRTVP